MILHVITRSDLKYLLCTYSKNPRGFPPIGFWFFILLEHLNKFGYKGPFIVADSIYEITDCPSCIPAKLSVRVLIELFYILDYPSNRIKYEKEIPNSLIENIKENLVL